MTTIIRKDDDNLADGNISALPDWSERLGRHPELPNRKAKLLQQQKGKCPLCGMHFQDGDVMEEDHITPRALGGKDYWSNRQLLHRHCHDEKTAIDLKKIREKKHSDIFNKLSHFWEKVEWEWIDDIPVYKG